MSSDYLGGCHSPGEKRVVEADEHDYMCDAGLRQDITIEPRLDVLAAADTTGKHSIAGDTLIDRRHFEMSVRGGEQPRQLVRIGVIGVGRSPLTVGDRVAEGYNDAGLIGRSNFHAL